MAKKIQKKQIEDGVFVETKSTYSAPTQDNEFVQKKYVDDEVAKKADASHTHSWTDITNKPRISVTLADTAISRTYTIGLTGADGSSGRLIIPKAVSWNDVTDKPTFPTLPSWVTQTKPTYDWTEIQNKPEIDIELKYKRLTEVTGNITDLLKDKPGVFRVGDSARLQGMPNEDWYHFFGGRHYNGSEQRNYYFALRSHTVDNYFWLGRQNNTENVEWFKFVGFKDLNNNKLFREWNLEHGLSAYIGNSNVFNIRTGFSGGASDVLFGVQNDKVVVPTYLESANELKGSELWLDTDKNGNVTRFRANGDTLTIGNKEWNDLRYLYTKGIKIWGNVDNNKVVLAGGGVTDINALKNENIKIGGRNYLLNSKQTLITSTATGITGVIGISPDFKKILLEQPTTSFVVSCFVKYTNLTSVSPKSRLGFEGAITYTDDTIQYINYWLPVTNNDIGKSIKGERFYRVMTLLPNKIVKEVTISGIFVQITADQAEVSNPKIEIGNKPTDWTPAPEDLVVEKTWEKQQHSLYGESLVTNLTSVQREVVIDNGTSRNNLWTANNELNIGSRNVGGYAKINCNGYKIQGKDDNFVLTAGGNSISKSELLSLPRGYDTSTSVVLPATTVNDTVFVKASITLGLENIPNKGSVSFLKTFDGGSVTFICAGKNIIYTGDNSFNGKDGSTATVTIFENKCYIRIANV
jgi:hypothetical protein|nr:MAG TPA: hypothetical protein [Caudoviricetes sp.]